MAIAAMQAFKPADGKGLHPFFEKQPKSALNASLPEQLPRQASTESMNRDGVSPEDGNSLMLKGGETRDIIVGRDRRAASAEAMNISSSIRTKPIVQEATDVHESARKRRKLTPPEDSMGVSWLDQLKSAAAEEGSNVPLPIGAQFSNVANAESTSGSDKESQSKGSFKHDDDDAAPPPKILKLNGTGGLGSPKTKDAPESGGEAVKQQPKRSRKRKQLIVVLRYKGAGRKAEDPNLRTDATKVEAKQTHPFFLTKSVPEAKEHKAEATAASTSPTKQNDSLKGFSTPGKLKHQAMRSSDNRNLFQQRSGLSVRILGTVNPPWPAEWRRTIHSREFLEQHRSGRGATGVRQRTKRKAKLAHVPPEEDVVRLSHTIDPDSRRHRPQKLVISREEVLSVVSSRLSRDATDSAATKRTIELIATTLSPFDRGECENSTWVHKYAPRQTAEVLQGGKTMQVLKAWLQGQRVGGVHLAETKTKKKKKKKRKKLRQSDELDDFIVNSDDDDGSLRDMSEDEEGKGFATIETKSMIQATSDNKGTNAILLSGPHGCGKTAAAFAVAKELGFDVFEIGPSARRSGKDIIEKVGDMTSNHHVRRDREASTIAVDEETDSLPSVVDASQGMLTSFFGQSSKVAKSRKVEKPTKASRQSSMILFEEVDVLFEQDKQFWDTVLDLAVQSKRPIIMTCNDENLLPMDDLSVHAVLRFRRPPEHLAVDHLLLIAAVEGHILERSAVKRLYEAKRCDLRASIMDLQFWCQMAVGDPKGGLGWFLTRWPPGADLDDQGRTLRVISKDTFFADMTIFGRDPEKAVEGDHEELARHACKEWNVEPSSLHTLNVPSQSLSNLEALCELQACADLVSAADVFCRVDMPSISSCMHQDQLDPTQPEMMDSQRINYIAGYPLLHADILTDFSDIDARISTHIHTSRLFRGSISQRTCLIEHLREEATNPTPSIEQEAVRNQTKIHSFLEPIYDGLCHQRVVEDIAPYARSIAAYDIALERQRDELDGGRANKRARTSRVSRSALEGTARVTTRRERWFDTSVNLPGLLSTGMKPQLGGEAFSLARSSQATSRASSVGDAQIEDWSGEKII